MIQQIKLLLILSAVSFAFCAFANDYKKMLFTSPIIYRPVIDLALSRNTKTLNKRQPTKITPFNLRLIVTQFSPSKEDKKQFDSFIQISFKEISNIKFLVFKKNNLVHQLHVVRIKDNTTSIVKYERNIDSLLSQIPIDKKTYIAKTQKVIAALLIQEDFLTNLPLGEYVLTFKLELLTGVSIGDVYISGYPYYHSFCFSKGYINSALRNTKTRALIFAITFWNKYISLANLFDEKILNGFECYFYPNQGLKYLTNLQNGNQGDVTTWKINGKDEKKISFREWFQKLQTGNHP